MRALPWILLAVGVAFGAAGFHALKPEDSWPSALYLGVQLITLNSGSVDGAVPWTLEIGRWLAPVATIWGLLASFADGLRQGLARLTIRRTWRAHAIVCGAGDTGTYAARALLRAGRKVIVLGQSGDQHRLSALSAQGARCFVGDARSISTLLGLGLQHAGLLFAALGEDDENLALSIDVAARESLEHHAGHSLSVFAHLRDDRMAAVIEDSRIWPVGSPVRRIRTFNRYRNAARTLLQLYPVELIGPSNGRRSRASEVHVVVGSLDPYTEAMLLQVASVGQYSTERPVFLHLLMTDAEVVHRRLSATYPGLAHCCQVTAEDVMPSGWADRVACLISGTAERAAWTILPGFADASDAFVKALRLAALVYPDSAARVQIVVGSTPGDALSSVVSAVSPAARQIRFLPLAPEGEGVETLLGERLDDVARRIHEEWLAGQRADLIAALERGDKNRVAAIRNKATFQEWRDVSEEERQFNRSQADHLLTKVRSLACTRDDQELLAAALVIGNGASGLDTNLPSRAMLDGALERIETAWASLTATEIEDLARMEHERWCAGRWIAGWQFAPKRNDQLRWHPDLQKYDLLSEGTKEFDRDAVRMVCKHLVRLSQ